MGIRVGVSLGLCARGIGGGGQRRPGSKLTSGLHVVGLGAAGWVVVDASFLFLQTECLNYIRVLQPLGPGALYVCGTNAFQPTCDYLVSWVPPACRGLEDMPLALHRMPQPPKPGDLPMKLRVCLRDFSLLPSDSYAWRKLAALHWVLTFPTHSELSAIWP